MRTAPGPELCLVSAAGGSAFTSNLLDVIADAVRAAGGRARTVVGAFPEPGPDRVYVVEPREYFTITREPELPSAGLRRRTIGLCVSHPGTAEFDAAAAILGDCAAAICLGSVAVAELRRRGILAERFQLGYSPLWDVWGGDLESQRALDVVHIGSAWRRPSLLLGSYARDLDKLSTRLLNPPNEAAAETLTHLAGSRFLLALHREPLQPLDWVRAVQAMCNGCVVLSEPATDLQPLVSGEHLLVVRPESLGAVAAALADDPLADDPLADDGGLERRVRAAAYECVRELDLDGSARMLVELASSVNMGSRGSRGAPRAFHGGLRPVPEDAADIPSWDARFAGERSLSRTPAVDGLGYARAAGRVVLARRAASSTWVPAQQPLFTRGARAEIDAEVDAGIDTEVGAWADTEVDVVLVRRPGEVDPDDLVSDLLAGTVLPRAVLVGEDGVIPRRTPRPAHVLAHEPSLGRGFTRNALLARSTAEWLLVLDGDLRASRYLLERLLAAADGVDVVHCLTADPVTGLVGVSPPAAEQLRELAYLGSGYLVRRKLIDAIGGWPADARLEGLEDHVFWRLVAIGGYPTALVRQVLLRRDHPDPPVRPMDLDGHQAWSLVQETVAAWRQ